MRSLLKLLIALQAVLFQTIIINPKLANIDKKIIEVERRISFKNWSHAQETTLKLAKKELISQRDALDFPNQ